MARLRIARQAWADIEDVQRYTEENFGPAQRVAYERLMGAALEQLQESPSARNHLS